MNCKEFSNLLDAYLDGSLPEADAQKAQEHAAHCSECASLLTLRQDCRRLDEEIEVPEAFSSSWRRMIKEEAKMDENKTPKKPLETGRWKKWLAIAAAVVFVLGGTLISRDSMAPRTVYRTSQNAAGTVSPSLKASDARSVTNFAYSTSAAEKAPMEMAAAYEDAYYDMEDYEVPAAEEAASNGSARTEKIIRSASFTIRTTEYDADLERLQTLTGDLGGRVEYLSASGDASSGQTRSASLTVRIPSGRLDEFLDGAQAIGSVTSLTQEREDVSDSYYDIQTRLETQQAKLKRLQSLMQAAEDVSDVLEIESAIADAQYYIDRYTGQISSYDSRVDYSTVHISIREVKIQEAEDVSLGQRIASGLQDSLQEGLWFLEDMCVFLVSALPWLALIAAVIVAVCLIVKKRNPKKKG
jgi:hypothetical protein